jgi:hypothetical protein
MPSKRPPYREILGIQVQVNLLGMTLCERRIASFSFHGISRGKLPVYMRR